MADRYGLATRQRGRARLDGLHERYHARLTDWGLGQPANGPEWRRADALVLQWARLEPRATATDQLKTAGVQERIPAELVVRPHTVRPDVLAKYGAAACGVAS